MYLSAGPLGVGEEAQDYRTTGLQVVTGQHPSRSSAQLRRILQTRVKRRDSRSFVRSDCIAHT